MISIIIPSLNEEEPLRSCLEAFKQNNDIREIIIADGGSSDRTIEIAEGFQDVKVVRAGKGRGLQMNAGAFSAKGDILLFLHADTLLQEGWSQAIEGALKDSAVVGGAFTFAINNPGKKYRMIEEWVKLRCLLFRLPYGDQGIFVKRDIFKEIGGYKNIPLMEDVDLIERMKARGRIAILGTRVLTSERRWLKKGLLYTAAVNQLIMLLYRIGVSPHKLAKIYYR
jgi:rSAM/selenodomain-associated transferase 2